jgi:hypothetical protein
MNPRAARNIAKKFDARNAIRRADLGFGLSLGNAFVRIKVMSRLRWTDKNSDDVNTRSTSEHSRC